jgi:hypothetical protein
MAVLDALLGQHPVVHWSLVYDVPFRAEGRLNLNFLDYGLHFWTTICVVSALEYNQTV